MFEYNKNRSKNTIIIEKEGAYNLCLYRESQVLYSSNSLQDVKEKIQRVLNVNKEFLKIAINGGRNE